MDEVSLFMKNRTDDQRVEDEKTLVVLFSNRLAKTHCLPVWTICSLAQQALESKMGVKNIITPMTGSLRMSLLLQDESNFYDIVACPESARITMPDSIEPYFQPITPRDLLGFSAIGSGKVQSVFPVLSTSRHRCPQGCELQPYHASLVRAFHAPKPSRASGRSSQTNSSRSGRCSTTWRATRKTLPVAPRRVSPPSVPSSTTNTRRTKPLDALSGRRPKGWLKVYASLPEDRQDVVPVLHRPRCSLNGLSVEEVAELCHGVDRPRQGGRKPPHQGQSSTTTKC